MSDPDFPGLKPKLGLADFFFFGMYKGDSVADVLESNPAYILWCDTNLDWVTFTDEVLKAAHESSSMMDGVDESDYELDYILGLGVGAEKP